MPKKKYEIVWKPGVNFNSIYTEAERMSLDGDWFVFEDDHGTGGVFKWEEVRHVRRRPNRRHRHQTGGRANGLVLRYLDRVVELDRPVTLDRHVRERQQQGIREVR